MQKVALNAVTSTTTSAAINVENLRDISIEFLSASILSGNGVFTIDVSNNGTDWETAIAFINPLSTTPATRITGQTLSTNTVMHCYLGKDFGAKMIRVICTVTTDGSYTAIVVANKITI